MMKVFIRVDASLDNWNRPCNEVPDSCRMLIQTGGHGPFHLQGTYRAFV